MSPETPALLAVILVALVFAYTNGFQDAANSLATSISTRALGPRAAVIMAASMNMIGAFLGEGVARTIGQNIIAPPEGADGLNVLFAALVGAIVWNIATWYKGMPSSASHALVGGMIGAALASSSTVEWSGVGVRFALPMLLSPLIGGAGGFLVMLAIMWLFRRASPRRVGRRFKLAQSVSAAAMSLGNGLQDAQKTMGVVVLALVTTGYQVSYDVPVWVVAAAAVAMSLGTLTGGWRIMRTLGRRVMHLDPPTGFAAESTVAVVSYATSFIWQVPISSTHTITSAIIGVGATRRLSAIRWGVAGNIVAVWLLTLPGAAAIAALTYGLVKAIAL
ncbi:inorganic phosphate transporter [Nocardiopsis gilva YIM 90087]|uniref:Inorganic phosphate transporter n=1 Tax=Nocardiopsis gilva YIM 90087 TaxID=1235441 RepID=A0A223S1Y2_9ACTN|nr:inorganic phosphate transporter [Nocardiopsis gilva]ASU82136.1 inorganic phosphate transporter [Nocardiopsis gilva YIM 90087]